MKKFKTVLALTLSLLMAVLVAMLPVAQVSADVLATTFYHNDALGSPVAATDESGNVKWREQYKPYGEKIVNELEAIDNSRWYTGHPHDEETGLTYAGARYYDPVVGRFMGVDSVSAAAAQSNPMMFNRYAYGNNNPYKYVDPDGEAAFLLGLPFLGGTGTASGGTFLGFTGIQWLTGLGAGGAIATATTLMNESATGEDAVDIITGGEEPINETSRGDTTTQHFPPISGKEADGKMSDIKDLDGVSVNETENERGNVTVVTTADGTRVIDRKGGGDVRGNETQSSNGNTKTKTRVKE